MKRTYRWTRRILAGVLVLLFAAWAVAEAAQWVLRVQGKLLLADIERLTVNHSTAADAQAVMTKWRKWGYGEDFCKGDLCSSYVRIRHVLPKALRGNTNDEATNWLPRLVDDLGLRNAAVGGAVTIEHGVVTGKSFSEEVELPVRDWFLRGAAFVPDLNVGAGEKMKFAEFQQAEVLPAHPFRLARRLKGRYGLGVTFTPEEASAEQAALMDFHFSCITSLIPCKTESEILPEGALLLDEGQ